MSALEKWMYRDPAEVLERMEDQQPNPEAARAALERIFSGENMAREMDFRVRIGTPMHNRLQDWGWVMRVKETHGRSPTADICHRLAVRAGKKPNMSAEPPDPEQLRDAFEIERAWRNPLMPRQAKGMLSAYYVHRFHPKAICRGAAIRFADFDAEMSKACEFLTTVMERLAFRQEAAHNPHHNLTADT